MSDDYERIMKLVPQAVGPTWTCRPITYTEITTTTTRKPRRKRYPSRPMKRAKLIRYPHAKNRHDAER